MASIERKLTFLRLAILAAAILLIIAPIWFWVSPDSFRYISSGDPIVQAYGGIERLSSAQRVAGYLVTMIPVSLIIWSLALLYKLTRLLAAGQWFERSCEPIFNRIGVLLLIYAVASILHHTLLVLVLTITNPPGERILNIQIGGSDLGTIVPALMALVIAHMVRLARAQRDELNQII